MEPLQPLRSIPGPRDINRNLPDAADERDKDLERDAQTNDPEKREKNKDHQKDYEESGGKPKHHHGGANPNLGKNVDLDV
ncbi:MAG TPA: hypothetical protein VKA08_12165 [Balneolales bacterium]|nr:hypothetical protein [Balneolales bacterium]